MAELSSRLRRVLVGAPVRTEGRREVRHRRRTALPVFGADALSSVAYAPDEVLLTLALAGVTALLVSPWVGAAVALLLLTVVASYRHTVRAYPTGGGDYEVATVNLGARAGVGVGSALLVDYVLTVAVSLSAGAQYLALAVPVLRGAETWTAAVLLVVLAAANLRGARESARLAVVPVYLLLAGLGVLAVVGAVRYLRGDLPAAPSAAFELTGSPEMDAGLVGLAGALLLVRAFAQGSVALTGVEGFSHRVPSFHPPEGRRAASTLGATGVVAAVVLVGVLLLARATEVRYVLDPQRHLLVSGRPPGADFWQEPVLGQVAQTVLGTAAVVVLGLALAVVLVVAANSSFTLFPVLASLLARDEYLPRQLRLRGESLAFSHGIVVVGTGALLLVVVFGASVHRLVQLYIVGVFISFTLSQWGMVRHWTSAMRTERDRRERRRQVWARTLATVGAAMTGTVLVVVVVTKFTYGAWVSLLAFAALYLGMQAVHRYYGRVRREVAVLEPEVSRSLPGRTRGIVLVSSAALPSLRAVSYARAARHSTLDAVTVAVEPEAAEALLRQWIELDLPVPLTVLDSPFRELARPFLDHVRRVRAEHPRDVLVVYVPEFAVRHWWEEVLHNQATEPIKDELAQLPGVVVAVVPWQFADG